MKLFTRMPFALLLLCILSLILLIVYWGIEFDKGQNTATESIEGGEHYAINTPACQIVSLGTWGDHIAPFFHPVSAGKLRWPPDCAGRSRRHWTYVNRSNIVINATNLRATGFSMDTISCCYKGIERVPNDTAEMKHVRFTDECHPMPTASTPSQFEFVRLICTGAGFPLPASAVLYKQFHALVLPSVIPKRKVRRWQVRDQLRPPNVVVIGIDSMSRLNVRRAMPKTWSKLKETGAVEMFGYNKVGQSTHANLATLLSGHDGDTLYNLCHEGGPYANPNGYGTEDDCPYIWHEFDAANYATALIEDRIELALGNLVGKGFIHKPVDFYFRPFMQAVYDHQPYYQMSLRPKPNAMDCIGHQTVDDVMLGYVHNALTMDLQIPKFIFSWNTNLAHEDITAPLNVDQIYHKFLVDTLGRNGDLSANSILIFLSDHGPRYGAFRQTLAGWLEEKLPALWIYLSPDLKERKPEWLVNLRANSGKLVSTFDLHRTLLHILADFKSESSASARKESGVGQSLFASVISDTRTCPDAGIPGGYCACSTPKSISVQDHDQILQQAANYVLRTLNEKLKHSSTCTMLQVREITAAAVITGNFFQQVNEDHDDSPSTNYLITFMADPGEILIEANVVYDRRNRTFIDDKQMEANRVNRMTRATATCIHDNKLEKFCYCE